MIIALALALLAALLYAPTLANGNVIDDDVLLNIDLSFVDLFFRPELIEGSPYYRPVTVGTYSMLHVFEAGVTRTRAAHFENMVLYGASTAGVFWLSCETLRGRPFGVLGAGVAALLFAVHPIHTESVAWITARPDMIVSLLLFGAIAAVRMYDRGAWWPWLAVAGSCMFLSPLAKELGVAAFLLVPAYGAFFVARRDGAASPATARASARAFIKSLAPVLLVSVLAAVAYLGLRIWALDGLGDSGLAWETIKPRPLLGAVGFYLEKLFAPRDLIAYYAVVPTDARRVAAGAAGVAAGAVALAAALRFGWRGVACGIVWTLLTLLFSMPLFVAEPSIAPIAERYLYLPSIGVAMIVAWCIASAASLLPRLPLGSPERLTPLAGAAWAAPALALAGISVLFSVMTLLRLPDWKDVETYWRTTTEDNPSAGLPHAGLGSV